MKICIDCGEPIKYGESGWGGGSLHARCRGKRGARSAMEQAKLSGKGHGNKVAYDPLVGEKKGIR